MKSGERRDQDGTVRHAVEPGDVQAQVPQSTGKNRSRDGGFVAVVGPVGEWSAW